MFVMQRLDSEMICNLMYLWHSLSIYLNWKFQVNLKVTDFEVCSELNNNLILQMSIL